MNALKKGFLAGLGVILPLIMTFLIVRFFVQLLTQPFEGMLFALLDQLGISQNTLVHMHRAQWLYYVSQLLILLLLFGVIMLMGFIARWFFVHELITFSDWVFHRIPVMNRLYGATKKTMHSLFNEESQKFTQAVLVPFPSQSSFSIGLIASDALPVGSDPDLQKKIAVFIPGTPNPMQGFLLMYHLEQVILLPISIEEALKCVVSCAVILPSTVPQKESKEPQ